MSNNSGVIKVVVMGPSWVGKTSLLTQFVDRAPPQTLTATVGFDFKIKPVKIGERTVRLQIWDTAGQDRLGAITRSYFRNTNVCVLVFDIALRETFDELEKWLVMMRENVSDISPPTPFVVVGNKIDLAANRQVSAAEAQEWCEKAGNLPYFETSTILPVETVDSMFEAVAALGVQHFDAKAPPPATVQPNSTSPTSKCAN